MSIFSPKTQKCHVYFCTTKGGWVPKGPKSKVFLCGKLGKPASLQAIFSSFYGSEENTKTEDFFGRGGGGGGRRSTDQAIY